MKKILSIVVPCYNEEEVLPYYYEETNKVVSQIDDLHIEYLFVNDGSKDNTLEVLKDLTKSDKRVKYVSFSRNFGKEAAIYAGLSHASGDFVVLMDADLQHSPKMIIEMYKYMKEGYDTVGTRRTNRKGEPPIRSFFAKKFYKIINRMSNVEMIDGAMDYRMMNRQVVEALLDMKEYNRYSKGLFSFVGFKNKWLECENIERTVGNTKWSFWGLVKYALEGITAFSTFPLVLSAFIGFILCLLSIILIIIIIIKTLMFGDPVAGWPSMICIILFLGGIQLLSLGVIGQYLSKTYLEVKKRPIYIVKETNIES